MSDYLLGFIIAVLIALTGVGAGTITTPMLIVFRCVPGTAAVGMGLLFATVVKLALVPTQIARGRVSWRALSCMLLGGVPGVLLGSLFLNRLAQANLRQLTNMLLGLVLVTTATYQIVSAFRHRQAYAARTNHFRLLGSFMFPVGIEVGFSSAGAGALGSAALLSCTTLAPSQAVGTDILFGFLISAIGSGARIFAGVIIGDVPLMRHLIVGGLVGAISGTLIAARVPKSALRYALWAWLLVLGMQIIGSSLHEAQVRQHWDKHGRHEGKLENKVNREQQKIPGGTP